MDTPTDEIDLSLDLGFTLGQEMPFDEAVEWANTEGFDFVELLLRWTVRARTD